MAEVKVLRRVRHNNLHFGEGEIIADLSQKQAQQLVDSGEASFDLEGGTPAAGSPAPVRESAVKKALLEGADSGNRKTVSEKAQARQQAKEEAPPEVVLPESFTTPEGSFNVTHNVKGAVSGYQFRAADAAEDDKPNRIKKAEYQSAYEASLEAAGEEEAPADGDSNGEE